MKMILTERQQQIKDNYSRVLESISDAAAKAGRSEDGITLLAATKTVCAEDILFAVDSLGITHIGENRTEEMCAKFDALRGHARYIRSARSSGVRCAPSPTKRI